MGKRRDKERMLYKAIGTCTLLVVVSTLVSFFSHPSIYHLVPLPICISLFPELCHDLTFSDLHRSLFKLFIYTIIIIIITFIQTFFFFKLYLFFNNWMFIVLYVASVCFISTFNGHVGCFIDARSLCRSNSKTALNKLCACLLYTVCMWLLWHGLDVLEPRRFIKEFWCKYWMTVNFC